MVILLDIPPAIPTNIRNALLAATNPSTSNPFVTASEVGVNSKFEWDAERVTGLTNSVYVAHAFGIPFDTTLPPPVVVALHEKSGAVSDAETVGIRNVTHTDYEINPEDTTVAHVLALSAGVYLVNGNLVIAGYLGRSTGDRDLGGSIWFPRSFLKTPAVALTPTGADQDTNPVAGNSNVQIQRFHPGNTTLTAEANMVYGTHGFAVRRIAAGNGVIAFIAIAPTSDPKRSAVGASTFDAAGPGSGSFKAGHKYEAGYLSEAFNANPFKTLSFAAAFSAAPVVVGSIGREQGATSDDFGLDSAPGVGSVDLNQAGAGAGELRCGIIAMDAGHDSVTDAIRLV